MESPVKPIADKPADYIGDPYPFFADKRRSSGVFRGTVMDYSKTPRIAPRPSMNTPRCRSTR